MDAVEEWVRAQFEEAGHDASHDISHVRRVREVALRLASLEQQRMNEAGEKRVINAQVVELAALCHDVGDAKYAKPGEAPGSERIRVFLRLHGFDADIVEEVVDVVENVSFRKELCSSSKTISVETCIVQDADRLDAIGAIGIARCLTFGGARGRSLCNATVGEMPPAEQREVQCISGEEYKKRSKDVKSATIDHFYEKLLRLKDMMKTPSGAQVAQRRHDTMLRFLEEFHKEWACIDVAK